MRLFLCFLLCLKRFLLVPTVGIDVGIVVVVVGADGVDKVDDTVDPVNDPDPVGKTGFVAEGITSSQTVLFIIGKTI